MHRGVIRVVFFQQNYESLYALTIYALTIHSDGRVLARGGDGFLLFWIIPIFTGGSEHKEANITQDDYDFLLYVINRRDSPNLRRDAPNWNYVNTTGHGWLVRVSTTTRMNTFYGALPYLYDERNIINKFDDKLFEINPFDLLSKRQ